MGFFYIKNGGMYKYFRYSKKFNIITGMDEKKWKEYYKFTFIRHPFDKFISAYKYLKLYDKNIYFLEVLQNEKKLTPYEYFHILLTLNDNLINNDDKIEFDYLGRYENLNEELINIFNKLGITKIKHKHFILNDIIINSSDSNKFFTSLKNDNISTKFNIDNYINEDFINLFNNKFKNDYDKFNYNKIDINNYKKFIYNSSKIISDNKLLIKKYNLKDDTNIFNFNLDLNIENNKNSDIDLILNNLKKNKRIFYSTN